MIVSVTVLGDAHGLGAAATAAKVMRYLEGGRTLPAALAKGGRQPGSVIELPNPDGGVISYYADSAGVRPGRWAIGRDGELDRGVFAMALAGFDPRTNEPLLSGRGRADGAAHARTAWREVDPDGEWFSARDLAVILGVSDSYAARLCREAIVYGGEAAEGIERTEAGWRVHRDTGRRMVQERNPARTVVGYDLTFSPPKSVSVLWAGADDATRAEVLLAIDEAVAAGLRYADRHALKVRVGGEQQQATDLFAANYLHTTSRALEPQLHHHVVVANYGRSPDGVARALDGRMLFLHAKTMGYVAAAELRHQLTARLGVVWGPIRNGLAEIVGVPEAARDEMSTRSREVYEEMGRLGLVDPTSGQVLGTAAERQVAAWDTRAPKVHGVDVAELQEAWNERLTSAGYGPEARRVLLGVVPGPGRLSEAERLEHFAALVRIAGITANEAVFDRRRVVQELATFAGDRLSGDAIDALADDFLANPEVVRLQSTLDRTTRNVIRRGDGRVVAVPPDAIFSTRAMLALEGRAVGAYRRGRTAHAGQVKPRLLDEVFERPHFARLTDEQREFVRSLTTSGMTIQAAVGAAGTGKTTALEAAVTAWQEAGFKVLGTAVGGTQTVVLGEEANVEARTVASTIMRYFGAPLLNTIDHKTVVLLDEASLLSTQDFAALARAVEERGACLRLVGDPAQHSSVAAGGIFRYFVEHYREEVPQLTRIYRQQGDEMAEVRLANTEYREGKIHEALERLDRDGRILEAETAEEAFDLLTCAWYGELRRRAADPTRRRSSMTAEHHFERLALNARARALLKADGTLTGPELVVRGLAFQAGDQVIARKGDRHLLADGARYDEWVRNGALGKVLSVEADHLMVGFERWGTVRVPRSYLETELSGGVIGALQHAYALTTYAAEGATFAVATPLITDASSTEGVYVSITRGQFDLQAVIVRRNVLTPPPTDDGEMPVLRDETRARVATARTLEAAAPERLARDLDPFAARVHELVNAMRLPELDVAVRSSGPHTAIYEAALAERARVVGARAVLEPPADVVAHVGLRPDPGPSRAVWDQAVGSIAIWRERETVNGVTGASGVSWALGLRPRDEDLAADYDLVAGLVAAAERARNSSQSCGEEPMGDSGPTASTARSYRDVADGDLSDEHADLVAAMRRHEQQIRALDRTLRSQRAAVESRRQRGLDPSAFLAQIERIYERLRGHRAGLEGLQASDAELVSELDERGLEVEVAERSAVPAARAEAPILPAEPGGPEISGPSIGI